MKLLNPAYHLNWFLLSVLSLNLYNPESLFKSLVVSYLFNIYSFIWKYVDSSCWRLKSIKSFIICCVYIYLQSFRLYFVLHWFSYLLTRYATLSPHCSSQALIRHFSSFHCFPLWNFHSITGWSSVRQKHWWLLCHCPDEICSRMMFISIFITTKINALHFNGALIIYHYESIWDCYFW